MHIKGVSTFDHLCDAIMQTHSVRSASQSACEAVYTEAAAV